MEIDERIEQAVRNTEILRAPRQSLSTFGLTNIYYYLLTEPVYKELVGDVAETVIREGRVIAERPRIVTPYYLSRIQGFSDDARKYFDMLIHNHGPNAPGLFYAYRNEPKESNIVSDNWLSVAGRLNEDIEKRGDPLVSIIKGIDELWDVSLMKFIYEMTRNSLQNNVAEMGRMGLLDVDSRGIPADARLRIEEMFARVEKGDADPHDLKRELEHWDLFEEYQDRFFDVFRRKG